jgi:hypothetical protein
MRGVLKIWQDAMKIGRGGVRFAGREDICSMA